MHCLRSVLLPAQTAHDFSGRICTITLLLPKGVLTLSMGTYIKSTADRFERPADSPNYLEIEITGRLLWYVLCVRGPELE
jgi:hypothetical protein